jgi:hypothetical protein
VAQSAAAGRFRRQERGDTFVTEEIEARLAAVAASDLRLIVLPSLLNICGNTLSPS